jgi:hypothetical protein
VRDVAIQCESVRLDATRCDSVRTAKQGAPRSSAAKITRRTSDPRRFHRPPLDPPPPAAHPSRTEDPAKPDPTLIRLIHRDHDGHFALVIERDFSGASTSPATLEEDFAAIAEQLRDDAFFSLNAFYRPGHSPSPLHAELRAAHRQGDSIRWLCAAYVDLDGRRKGLNQEQALAFARRLEANGAVPPVSIWLRSGRGVWGIWLIRADDSEGPARAWPEAAAAHRRIEMRLVELFADAGADPGCTDTARVMRIPGSRNGKSGSLVRFEVSIDDATGQPFAYTLNALANWLGVDGVKPRQERGARKPPNPRLSRNGKRGVLARAELCRRRFERLCELRGPSGFEVGIRHYAAWILALCLRHSKASKRQATALLTKFYKYNCAQPESDRVGRQDAIETVASAYRTKSIGFRVSSSKVGAALLLTAEEADELAVLGGIKPWCPSLFHARPKPILPGSSRDHTLDRREALRLRLIGAGAAIPSLRQLSQQLAACGFAASASQVRNDLKALGIDNPRARPRAAKNHARCSA